MKHSSNSERILIRVPHFRSHTFPPWTSKHFPEKISSARRKVQDKSCATSFHFATRSNRNTTTNNHYRWCGRRKMENVTSRFTKVRNALARYSAENLFLRNRSWDRTNAASFPRPRAKRRHEKCDKWYGARYQRQSKKKRDAQNKTCTNVIYSSGWLIASPANSVGSSDLRTLFGLVTRETLLRSRRPQLALSGRLSADTFPFTQKEPRIYAFISAPLSQSGGVRPAFTTRLLRPGRTLFYKAGNYALTT